MVSQKKKKKSSLVLINSASLKSLQFLSRCVKIQRDSDLSISFTVNVKKKEERKKKKKKKKNNNNKTKLLSVRRKKTES